MPRPAPRAPPVVCAQSVQTRERNSFGRLTHARFCQSVRVRAGGSRRRAHLLDKAAFTAIDQSHLSPHRIGAQQRLAGVPSVLEVGRDPPRRKHDRAKPRRGVHELEATRRNDFKVANVWRHTHAHAETQDDENEAPQDICALRQRVAPQPGSTLCLNRARRRRLAPAALVCRHALFQWSL